MIDELREALRGARRANASLRQWRTGRDFEASVDRAIDALTACENMFNALEQYDVVEGMGWLSSTGDTWKFRATTHPHGDERPAILLVRKP